MIRKLIPFSLFFLPILLTASLEEERLYLNGRIDPLNGRHKTFSAALELMNERNAKVIVETGTERWQEAQYCFDGDGGSTIIFAHWATDHRARMYSVDINETHIRYCEQNTLPYANYLTLVLGDSVSFLQNFSEKIDLLYLDSYDYDENNPRPAQEHCLREAMAAEDKLTDKSIVMIDDCNIPGGGKGLLAIQYLLSRGWSLYKNHHQVILLRS